MNLDDLHPDLEAIEAAARGENEKGIKTPPDPLTVVWMCREIKRLSLQVKELQSQTHAQVRTTISPCVHEWVFMYHDSAGEAWVCAKCNATERRSHHGF